MTTTHRSYSLTSCCFPSCCFRTWTPVAFHSFSLSSFFLPRAAPSTWLSSHPPLSSSPPCSYHHCCSWKWSSLIFLRCFRCSCCCSCCCRHHHQNHPRRRCSHHHSHLHSAHRCHPHHSDCSSHSTLLLSLLVHPRFSCSHQWRGRRTHCCRSPCSSAA